MPATLSIYFAVATGADSAADSTEEGSSFLGAGGEPMSGDEGDGTLVESATPSASSAVSAEGLSLPPSPLPFPVVGVVSASVPLGSPAVAGRVAGAAAAIPVRPLDAVIFTFLGEGVPDGSCAPETGGEGGVEWIVRCL